MRSLSKNIRATEVWAVIETYPVAVQEKLMMLRDLIYDIANKEKSVLIIEETLKWHEPAYLCKGGSTIRFAWKAHKPHQFGIYFNCKTQLIEIIVEVYGPTFVYEGNRGLIFEIDAVLPIEPLRQCFLLALTYHSRKHLPLLGL